MENDKCSVSSLVQILGGHSCRRFCKSLYNAFESNPNIIRNKYEKGCVPEASLLRMLRKSVFAHQARYFIPDVLFLVEPRCITTRVIRYALRYPGAFRNTLLSTLGHIWLKPEQLEILNKHLSTPEAFYKLFLIYANNPDTSSSVFLDFLRKNKRFSNELPYLVNLLEKESDSIPAEKKNVFLYYFRAEVYCVNEHSGTGGRLMRKKKG